MGVRNVALVLCLTPAWMLTGHAARAGMNDILVGLDEKVVYDANGQTTGPGGKDAVLVMDVTDPAHPTLITRIVEGLNDTHKSWWECDTGIAFLVSGEPGWRVKRMTQIYDLSDPAHPKVLQTFNGVTSILQDPSRGLIYLTNTDGLWILNHARPGLTPAKKKRACGSEDAIASMPPDCQ